ncbi:hypothetical protein [Acaryochloris sp. CCMEE 5410]|uniref:hypothetical protein n=1 Tax=Acaryochloris sp. CCMEE 5410 TaxID=310037 RepID=UPI0002484111|nr:hypothetical protein [Acaryochloris sp. CCMEE 5410]KAI9134768.1 hypothetical protein ON05_016900 [Acaryochloris sp. CCMEE 5410]
MSTPEALEALVTQLTQELGQVQKTAQYGLDITRQKLSTSPDNPELTQLFAIFNNVSFFTENYKARIQTTVRAASETNLQSEQLQDAGQGLATLLGVVVEAKLLVENSVRRLDKLP